MGWLRNRRAKKVNKLIQKLTCDSRLHDAWLVNQTLDKVIDMLESEEKRKKILAFIREVKKTNEYFMTSGSPDTQLLERKHQISYS
jgi:hypothetical protein